jgi:Transposase DDE domain group 1
MMMIPAGYEDCDDIDTLKTDPAFKIACDRAPETGVDLMSQPTLSRLENMPDAMALYKIRGFMSVAHELSGSSSTRYVR